MTETKYFRSGVPTAPDIVRIMDTIGVPVEGMKIPYETIESILGVTSKTHRWKSVTNAWREELLKKYGMTTKCEGRHYIMQTDSERLTSGTDFLKSAVKKTEKAAQYVSLCREDKLDSNEQRIKHAIQRTASQIQVAYLEERKNISHKQLSPPPIFSPVNIPSE
jgi:hypothetical protein